MQKLGASIQSFVLYAIMRYTVSWNGVTKLNCLNATQEESADIDRIILEYGKRVSFAQSGKCFWLG